MLAIIGGFLQTLMSGASIIRKKGEADRIIRFNGGTHGRKAIIPLFPRKPVEEPHSIA
ncbi:MULTISPECIES: hypothetical protein [Rhizobium/Agrobacterium group]|jgi:hypothetical protein|uniref:Uncharacterized protein n=1 Tax=Agrobacterium tumefaciens TaxID=358 RepID=A0AAJ4N721_AGRTU|nr:MULTISPECIES: hypothetical protein [Rhizobium/Agrobacterium group]EHJ99844.1 hypothetical protein AT5A_00265 [Agrobacterium tumefaciens 5A]MDP9758752.1 hypothetical protein [Agrobacterium tumefaciens]MDQ1219998.1 hypothetical protein [Agrobacterium sp. SORGH_AS_0745]MDX8324470.1 hypothetical protein [Agrobacterium tumefaciens]MEA1842473.1 hypothetical protein [Agrobacterium tumefaciens]